MRNAESSIYCSRMNKRSKKVDANRGARPASYAGATRPGEKREIRYRVLVSTSNPHGEFGRYLGARMKEHGYTAGNQLAIALAQERNDDKVTPATVNRWINGSHQPSIAQLRDLARVLDLPVLELVVKAGHIHQHEVDHYIKRTEERRADIA